MFKKIFKTPKKVLDLLNLLSECFEEINFTNEAVEIKLNKKLILKNSKAICMNSDSVIILNTNKLYLNPVKFSAISKEELDNYNDVEKTN
jgi:hypothetical protein